MHTDLVLCSVCTCLAFTHIICISYFSIYICIYYICFTYERSPGARAPSPRGLWGWKPPQSVRYHCPKTVYHAPLCCRPLDDKSTYLKSWRRHKNCCSTVLQTSQQVNLSVTLKASRHRNEASKASRKLQLHCDADQFTTGQLICRFDGVTKAAVPHCYR